MQCNVVILAGGLGTRLTTIPRSIPKALADVNGLPFLHYVFKELARNNIENVTISTSHLANKISAYFGDCYLGISVRYSYCDRLLGTGGSLKAAVFDADLDRTIVWNGDTFISTCVADLVNATTQPHQAVLLCSQVEDASRYGKVRLQLEAPLPQVLRFEEKSDPSPGYVYAGVACVGTTDILSVNEETFDLSKRFFANKVARGSLYALKTESTFVDIGVPADLEKFRIQHNNL